jgi:uncharacterized protein (DUF433 family)
VVQLEVRPEPVPLATDADGTVRVSKTRVTLDVVVRDFDEGASPEEVAQRHLSLDLADVYSVFTYYLRHRTEVQAYLLDRRERSEEVRLQNERRFPPEGVRERLLARRASHRR